MKIKVTDSCIVARRHADAGQILDVSDAEGRVLIDCGRAVRVADSAEIPPASVTTSTVAAPAVVTQSAPAKAARRTSK